MNDETKQRDIESIEGQHFACAECGHDCDPKWRAEYGLWRDENDVWFALHKWCVEAWMEKHRPRQPPPEKE